MANSNDLLEIQFERIGNWQIENGQLNYKIESGFLDSILYPNALYAFVRIPSNKEEDEVMYIGKTTRSLKGRFQGYKNPGSGQQTNIKVNDGIKKLLSAGENVDIFMLKSLDCLSWGIYHINLAAGLEDSLVRTLQPNWNGRNNNYLTETEVIESIGISEDLADSGEDVEQLTFLDYFNVTLGEAYFNQGFINPGVRVDHFFGLENEMVKLRIGQQVFDCRIDRRANGYRSPRLNFKRPYIDYIQSHYKYGDTIRFGISAKNEIELITSKKL